MTHGSQPMAAGGEWWTVIPIQLRIVIYLWLIAIVLAKVLPWLVRNGATAVGVASMIFADALLGAEYMTTTVRRHLGRAPGPATFTYDRAVVAGASGICSVARAAMSSHLLRTRRLRVWPILLVASLVIPVAWGLPEAAAADPNALPLTTAFADARAPFVAFDALVTTGHFTPAQNAAPLCPTPKSTPAHHKKKHDDGH